MEKNFSGKNKHCIIIDDEIHCTMFSEILKFLGAKVDGCGSNGFDAVKLFDKFRPDFVFLDIRMPKYDGFFAIERIRQLDQSAKIIAITGDIKEETTQKLQENNIPFLYKPFEIDQIAKILEDKTNF